MGTAALEFNRAGLIQLLIGVLLPILVALVTTMKTNPGIRAVLLLAGSALTAVGTSAYQAAENHVPWEWQVVVYGALFTFVTGVASYFGLWSPTGVSTAAKKMFGGNNLPKVITVTPVSVQDHIALTHEVSTLRTDLDELKNRPAPSIPQVAPIAPSVAAAPPVSRAAVAAKKVATKRVAAKKAPAKRAAK